MVKLAALFGLVLLVTPSVAHGKAAQKDGCTNDLQQFIVDMAKSGVAMRPGKDDPGSLQAVIKAYQAMPPQDQAVAPGIDAYMVGAAGPNLVIALTRKGWRCHVAFMVMPHAAPAEQSDGPSAPGQRAL